MPADAKSWHPGYVNSKVSRRRFLGTALAGAGAAAVLACGRGEESDLRLDDGATARQPGTVWLSKNDWKLADETKEAVRGGIYRGYVTEDAPSHLDPMPNTSSGRPTAVHTHEMLMARNRGPGIEPGTEAYNNPIGALAESWEISDDGATVTFTLRQNVKFHNVAPVNGRVMDIDDWRTSHDRHLEVGVYRLAIGDALDKAEYPDARHMVWKFKQPFAPLVDRIWENQFGYFILPKELNANPSIAERISIGTGFKILANYQPAIGFEYRKNPDYWGGDPFIEGWSNPIIPEYASAYAQFVRGNILDFVPTARDVTLLRQDAPGAVIVADPLNENKISIHKWGKHWTGTPLADERIRIAMRRAADYPGIAEFLSNRDAFESSGIPIEIGIMTHMTRRHPSYWLDPEAGELGSASQNYLHNPAEAKKLITAAGYNSAISLPYYISGTGAVETDDQLVIDSLTASGVFVVDVKQTPRNDYRININVNRDYTGTQSPNSGEGDFDYTWFNDYWSGRVGGTSFPDPALDRLLQAQRREMDFERRGELVRETQLYLAQKFYVNPAHHVFTTFSIRWPWVHNSNYGPSYPDVGGHLRWLDEGMPNRDKPI